MVVREDTQVATMDLRVSETEVSPPYCKTGKYRAIEEIQLYADKAYRQKLKLNTQFKWKVVENLLD